MKKFTFVAVVYHSFEIEAENAEQAEELMWDMGDQEWNKAAYDTHIDQIFEVMPNGEQVEVFG